MNQTLKWSFKDDSKCHDFDSIRNMEKKEEEKKEKERRERERKERKNIKRGEN